MNVELEESIQRFLARAAEANEEGTVAERKEIEEVNNRLEGIIPAWYIDLITTHPICGIECQWQQYPEEEDYDGRATLRWSPPQDIWWESHEGYPGAGILELGYFSVACDWDGMGDPYFISVNEGDHPPLYQVYHEHYKGDPELMIGDFQGRLVGKSLSEFFDQAMFD